MQTQQARLGNENHVIWYAIKAFTGMMSHLEGTIYRHLKPVKGRLGSRELLTYHFAIRHVQCGMKDT
jgi:hypothetical protein